MLTERQYARIADSCARRSNRRKRDPIPREHHVLTVPMDIAQQIEPDALFRVAFDGDRIIYELVRRCENPRQAHTTPRSGGPSLADEPVGARRPGARVVGDNVDTDGA